MNSQEAYEYGFVKQCEARGVDPELLVKHAAIPGIGQIGAQLGKLRPMMGRVGAGAMRAKNALLNYIKLLGGSQTRTAQKAFDAARSSGMQDPTQLNALQSTVSSAAAKTRGARLNTAMGGVAGAMGIGAGNLVNRQLQVPDRLEELRKEVANKSDVTPA